MHIPYKTCLKQVSRLWFVNLLWLRVYAPVKFDFKKINKGTGCLEAGGCMYLVARNILGLVSPTPSFPPKQQNKRQSIRKKNCLASNLYC